MENIQRILESIILFPSFFFVHRKYQNLKRIYTLALLHLILRHQEEKKERKKNKMFTKCIEMKSNANKLNVAPKILVLKMFMWNIGWNKTLNIRNAYIPFP